MGPDCGFQKTASIGSNLKPSRSKRANPTPHRLEAAPVFCVARGVGEVFVPLGGIALFAIGEVVEMADDDDDCMGPEDGLIASSVVEEASLWDAAAAGATSLGSAPQESGNVGSFIRSCLLSEQKAFIECSFGAAGDTSRQFLKQQSPASKG